MNLKKTMAALMVGAMVLSAVPVLPAAPSFMNTAYAAKGGAKMSVPKSAPAAPKAPATSTNNASQSKSVSGNGSSYAPSKDAKSLDKNAPAANTKSNAAAGTNTQGSSRLGSFMRGIGLFAGGMLLGSMLSHLFGMGSGMFADIMGLLMNVIMVVAAVMVVRWLWNKFRGTKRDGRQGTQNNTYQQPLEMRQQERQDLSSKTQAQSSIRDIEPRGNGNDYNAKSTADRYRNR
nr:hypothetical protein [uncultured Mitsuokella sp.]